MCGHAWTDHSVTYRSGLGILYKLSRSAQPVTFIIHVDKRATGRQDIAFATDTVISFWTNRML